MSPWVIKGIRTGIKTSAYPRNAETAAGVTPGLPVSSQMDTGAARALVDICPTQVFTIINGRVNVDVDRCIHCYRCVRGVEQPARWDSTYEWGVESNQKKNLLPAFRKSINICVVDAGDCGSCLNEVRQLSSPYYNIHRLGFFITPTPRHADVLLVVGPGTDHMSLALQKIYNAIPTPKRVVAAGVCALSGGVFAESFTCSEGVTDILPVDVEVPGNPPPPLAILHGLLVAAGRKPPVDLQPGSSQANATGE